MEKIYTPEELYFEVIRPEDDEYFDSPVILIGIKDETDYNDIGGHNIDNELLEKCGLEPCELAESLFEPKHRTLFTIDEIKQNLIDNGFFFNR